MNFSLKLQIYRVFRLFFEAFFAVVRNVHKYNNHCCVFCGISVVFIIILLRYVCKSEEGRAVCTYKKSILLYQTSNNNIKYLFGAIFSSERVTSRRNYSSNKMSLPSVVFRLSISKYFFLAFPFPLFFCMMHSFIVFCARLADTEFTRIIL